MEHELELIIARLEILEIEVCNISYKPRDIGNLSFSTFSYPGNIGKWIFLISHILEILDRTIHTQSYPGNIGSYDPYISPILSYIWIVPSIFAPMLMSRGVAGGRRQRWRRRRRPNNSPIWPESWTITPKDQISRSGSIPHFDVEPGLHIRSSIFTKRIDSSFGEQFLNWGDR